MRAFGFIIAAPGFMWAIAALWTGSHPAVGDRGMLHRLIPGGVTIMLGVIVLFVTTLSAHGTSAFAGLLAGAALLGAGMGWLYPDLLGRCLAEPPAPDGISQDRMAAAAVLSESAGMTLSTTIAYTWLGTGLGLVGGSVDRTQLLYLALLPVAVVMIARLAAVT